MPKHRTLVGVKAAAEYVNTTERHIRALIYRRAIPYHKVGKYVQFDLNDIDAWLDANRVEAAAS